MAVSSVSFEPRIPAHLRPMVEAAILSNYTNCADAFAARPSATNWEALFNAMWARQAITSDTTMAAALPKLAGAGIGHWVDILRAAHEGK